MVEKTVYSDSLFNNNKKMLSLVHGESLFIKYIHAHTYWDVFILNDSKT